MTNGNCPFLTVWATKMFMAVDMVMPIDLKVSSADIFKSSSILKLTCAIVFSPLDAAYYTTNAFQRQASHVNLQYKTPFGARLFLLAFHAICLMRARRRSFSRSSSAQSFCCSATEIKPSIRWICLMKLSLCGIAISLPHSHQFIPTGG